MDNMREEKIRRICQNTSFFSVMVVTVLLFFGTGFIRQTGSLNFTAYDVIDAVNGLRSASGRPILQINEALMSAAQSHSEYQATVSQSSHSNVAGQAAAHGYGSGAEFVAGENVAALTIGTENSVSIIINEIWADSVHRGAMLNPKYTDIGVGVACDDTMVYITLNVAGLKAGTQTNPGTQPATQANSTLPPVLQRVTSTPMADGTVIHIVGYGQTLGTIAGMYGVTIQQLVDRNNIDPDKIYAGQKLWIMKVDIPSATSTGEPTLTAAPSKTPEPSATPLPSATATAEPTVPPEIDTRNLGIAFIFLLMGGFVVYLLFHWDKSSRSIQP
jgi:LysM repeat protein